MLRPSTPLSVLFAIAQLRFCLWWCESVSGSSQVNFSKLNLVTVEAVEELMTSGVAQSLPLKKQVSKIAM